MLGIGVGGGLIVVGGLVSGLNGGTLLDPLGVVAGAINEGRGLLGADAGGAVGGMYGEAFGM